MSTTHIDRMSIRRRPAGWPVMYQTWDKLVFLHWPVSPERLRSLIHPSLEIDTFEGFAWIAITPLTIRGLRPPLVPPLPLLSQTHELNVRTYVHFQGTPGVWFFSLDASNLFAVWGARIGFCLPYFHSKIEFDCRDRQARFKNNRISVQGTPPATFEATWTLDEERPGAEPDSLEFFLIERYALYSRRNDRLYRARIFHSPWPLRQVELNDLQSTMLQSHGLPPPERAPIVHAQARSLLVETWPPERLQ